MNKEKDIIIRVDSNLKLLVKRKSESLGLSVSSYIRTLILKDLKNE